MLLLQVKEDDLEEVLKACPDDKRADLVLLQEGCTEPLLKQYGVCRKDQVHCTLACVCALCSHTISSHC
jgi:hypothetical protein